jgi:hypothetical protein
MVSNEEKSRIRNQTMSSLRDEVEAIDVEDNDIVEFAVKIRDEDLLKALVNKKHAWEEFRARFGMENVPYVQTKEFRRIVEKYTTLTVGDAAEKEKWSLLKYFTSKAENPELKNLKLVKWLIDFVDNQVGKEVTQIQLSGEQGAGKTDFAFLLAELWAFQSNGRVILTNVENVEGSTFIDSRDSLERWLDENPGKEFMFVLDELNKHASGSDHEEVVQQFFEFVTFLRKKQGNYIVIGHTGTDIHPWIRELTHYVHKHSKKKATVYEGLGENGEPEGEIKTLRGIPQTSLDFDTFDESTWEWGEEQVRQCLGTNADGDRCGAVSRAEWGEEPDLFCDAHANQDEPHPDVPDEELVGTEFEGMVLNESEEQAEDEDQDEETEPEHNEHDDRDEHEGKNTSKKKSDPDDIDTTTSRGSDDIEENGSKSSQEIDEGSDSVVDSDSSVDAVPQKYWGIIEERTNGAYTKENVDDLSTFEQILNENQWNELQEDLDST